jgi:hypothetical protein
VPVDVSSLSVGNSYDRPELTSLWGYESFHAIGRGVFTPQAQNLIVVFTNGDQHNPRCRNTTIASTANCSGWTASKAIDRIGD